MKYIYTQTHSTTACSYLTPQAKMNFTKFTAFLDLEKVLIWVCVMELQTFITYCTHKLPFAVKIQIPITLRLRRRACKAREWLNYSSLGLGQGDAHDHHQNHPNKYLPMFIPAWKMTLLCFSCSMLPPQHTDSSVAFFHLQPFSQPHSKVSAAFFPFFSFHAGFPCPVCFHTTDSLSPAGAQQSVCPPAGPSYLSPPPITKPKTHQWERSACVRAYTPMC